MQNVRLYSCLTAMDVGITCDANNALVTCLTHGVGEGGKFGRSLKGPKVVLFSRVGS